jgi:pyruvate,water dikinase
VRGLGEAMVSGEVTPDSYLFDKADRILRERHVASADGGEALNDDQLRALVALTLQIEEQFGSPVDVEAALAGGRWYVLQARPVTA